MDWSDFDKQYPVKDGIVMTMPDDMNQDISPMKAKTFFDVHDSINSKYMDKDLLHDKDSMARLQMEFYDSMAKGFQGMDDEDIRTGGRFWWKIHRLIKYDEQFFKKGKMLFIGAGNCRLSRYYAQMGYDVTNTDISFNMLKIGKEMAEKENINMTYVKANAEVRFPFKDETFDTVYSLCVANHIVDWNNYFKEKLRCLKHGGIMLERMPNGKLFSFWRTQGRINEGVEIKALQCDPISASLILNEIGVHGKIWTHDRITKIDTLPKFIPRRIRVRIGKPLYQRKAMEEDVVLKPHLKEKDDWKGIYTMIKVTKE